MNSITPTRRRRVKTEFIRARCDEELKNSIYHVAFLQRLDASDIVRMACADYVQKLLPVLERTNYEHKETVCK